MCDDCYFALRDQAAANSRLQAQPLAERIVARFPAHWRANAAPLLATASRTAPPRVLEALRWLVTLAAVGHLGVTELCAVALARSFMALTQAPAAAALLGPVDQAVARALASAKGASHAPLAGLWVQRTMVLNVCLAFGLALAWQASWPLWVSFLQVGLPVAEAAICFLRWSILGILQELALETSAVWMLAQGYELPHMSAALLALPLHILLTLLFVYGWGGGVAGAALAAVASRSAQLAYVAGHVVVGRLHERTWGGASLDAFLPQALASLALQAAPLASAGSVLALAQQAPLLLAASLGRAALAPYVLLDALATLLAQPPAALSAAALYKVASLLRAGNGRAAKGTAWLTIFSSAASALAAALLMLTGAGALSLAFAHEPHALAEATSLMPLAALLQIWAALGAASLAVLEAAGARDAVLVLRVAAAFACAIPLALVLVYLAEVGLLGLLWAMVVGQALLAGQAFWRVRALNWAAVAQEARLRRAGAGLARARPRGPGVGGSEWDAWGEEVLGMGGDDWCLAEELFAEEEELMLELGGARFAVTDDDDDPEPSLSSAAAHAAAAAADGVARGARAVPCVRSLQLHGYRTEAERSRALSAAVAGTPVGQWVCGQMTKLAAHIPGWDEMLALAGEAHEGAAGIESASMASAKPTCSPPLTPPSPPPPAGAFGLAASGGSPPSLFALDEAEASAAAAAGSPREAAAEGAGRGGMTLEIPRWAGTEGGAVSGSIASWRGLVSPDAPLDPKASSPAQSPAAPAAGAAGAHEGVREEALAAARPAGLGAAVGAAPFEPAAVPALPPPPGGRAVAGAQSLGAFEWEEGGAEEALGDLIDFDAAEEGAEGGVEGGVGGAEGARLTDEDLEALERELEA